MTCGQLSTYNQKELLDETSKNPNILYIVCFSASWCKPCKLVKPRLNELCKDSETRYFFEIDIEDDIYSELIDEYQITSLPTTLIYKNSALLKAYYGTQNVNELYDYIQNNS